jgi:hypothetical protein
MGARHKLNRAYFHGSLLLAALAGLVAGSWLVFGLALVGLVVVSVATGEIRFGKRKR